MNTKNYHVMFETMMKRGSPAYDTLSGAFLDHLRIIAQSLDLVSYSQACQKYINKFPESISFIAARTPAILCNNYFNRLPGFNNKKFISWSTTNQDWGESLKKSFLYPLDIQSAVDYICISVEMYEDNHYHL